MNRSRILALSVLGLAIIAAPPPGAVAQPALNQPSGVAPPRLTRVEAQISDIDPLGVSLRQLSTDLRLPSGFRDVYRIEGSSGSSSYWGVSNPGGGHLFARRDGAITAVFPQGVYLDTGKRTWAMIPPGTVFFIGELPWERAGDAEEPPASPDRVDTRVDTRATVSSVTLAPGAGDARRREPPVPSARPIEEPPARPGIMTDEPLRRRTVRDLIMSVAPTPERKETAATAPAASNETSTTAQPVAGAAAEKKVERPAPDQR